MENIQELSTLEGKVNEKCRLCSKEKTSVSLGAIEECHKISYMQMLQYLSTVFSSTDHYFPPTNVCEECSINLVNCYSFIKKWEDNEKNWQSIPKLNLKIEACEDSDSFTDNLITDCKEEDEEDDNEIDKSEETPPVEPKEEKPAAKPRSRKRNKNTEKTKSVCQICLEEFETFVQLIKHKKEKNHIKTSRLKCDICQKLIRGASFRRHVLLHSGEKIEQCPICQERFTYQGNLKRHMRLHENKRPFECHLCDKNYTRNEQLKAHMILHSAKAPDHIVRIPISCDFCSHTFSFPSKLVLHHKRYHLNDTKKVMCELCGILQEPAELQTHLETQHKDDKRKEAFKCEVCEETFYGYQRFHAHKLKHKEKRFSCEQCGKMFIQEHELKTHMRMHTGEKPFVCEHCGRGFPAKMNLKLHLSVHSGATGATDKAFACETCGKFFSTRNSLYQHMLIHQGIKNHVCKICRKAFTQPQHLKQHIRFHTGEKPHMCSLCGKKFSTKGNLKQHFRVHTNEEPKHSCPICHKGFHELSAMRKHLKSHDKLQRASDV